MFDRNADLLSVTPQDDGTLVVQGDIDLAAAPVLDAAIIERERVGSVVLDLAGVNFIDSSGLRSLLSASRRAADNNSVVVLRSVGPEVHRLLEITGTASLFTIADSDA